jgi:pimeloyl-ACP methyl ester carboxylesterase
MKNLTLVQIKTEDGLTLPGTLYEAPNSKKVAIHLHGNGSRSVFYQEDQRDKQVKALNNKGVSFLLFNNRGAHYVKKLNVSMGGKEERKRFGTSYELIKDCIKDIDAAINFLEKLGYKEFYLIGESTGANKICVYHYYKPKNKVSKYVLTTGSGDVGLYYDLLGKKKFFDLLNESKEKIKQGKGEDIIEDMLPDIYSYVGFYDIANPDGDYNVFPFLEVMKNLKLSKKPLFRYYKSLNKPTLAIYGGKDEYALENTTEMVKILKEQKPEFEYHVIKDGDHALTRHQKEVSKLIAKWLIN